MGTSKTGKVISLYLTFYDSYVMITQILLSILVMKFVEFAECYISEFYCCFICQSVLLVS